MDRRQRSGSVDRRKGQNRERSGSVDGRHRRSRSLDRRSGWEGANRLSQSASHGQNQPALPSVTGDVTHSVTSDITHSTISKVTHAVYSELAVGHETYMMVVHVENANKFWVHLLNQAGLFQDLTSRINRHCADQQSPPQLDRYISATRVK